MNSDPFESLENQLFQIGEGDTIPGLELPLRHSRVGDMIRCICSARFAYGSAGRCVDKPKVTHGENDEEDDTDANIDIDVVPIKKRGNVAIVPPNMDLEYEIEITDHFGDRDLHPDTVQKHQSEISLLREEDHNYQKLVHRLLTTQSMMCRKDSGNRWFSYDEFGRASKAYSAATKLAESYFNSGNSNTVLDDSTSLEERIKAVEANEKAKSEPISVEDSDIISIYVTCLNNLAACKISQGEFSAAKDLCIKVLQFSPFNGKALLRAARSSLALDAFEECELCLKRLSSIENLEESLKNAAKVEMSKLRKAQNDYKAKEKQMQQRIANKLFATKDKPSNSSSIRTISKPGDAEKNERRETELHEEKTNLGQSNDNDKVVGTAVSVPAKSKPSSSNNMVLLVATSFAVIIVSLIIAFSKK